VQAPTGAGIDPSTGLLTWTTREADGPRDYNMTVQVSKPGGTLNTTMSFLVGVREVNTAPRLQPDGPFELHPGDFLVINNKASDADLPTQTLTFSSPLPLPQGAELDPVTGVLRWQVPDDPLGGTNILVIRVTDNDSSPLSSDQSIQCLVHAPLRIAINEIMHRPSAAKAEYVELMNYSASNPVDLSGWRLEGYAFVFPEGTILPPAGYLCVSTDVAAFQSAYGAWPRVMGNAVLGLPADGGLVRLLKPSATGSPMEITDEVQFALRPPWPAAAASQGASLQLIDPHQDHWRAGNWGAAVGTVTNTSVQVIALTNVWRYWQSADSPGSSWNSAEDSDSTWSSGRALCYVETADLPAPKNTALTLGSTTYYFRSHFAFNGLTDGARLHLSTVIDDGAVFYLNGQEVYRLGMPEGIFTPSTFAARTVSDAVLEGPFDMPATGLRNGDNVLAVEVHQINATSSDIVFGMAVELETQAATSWTPGFANSVAGDLPAFPSVWINEVLPNNTTGLADNAGERDPWIELYNGGAQVLNLDGWSMTDDYSNLGKSFFPAGTSIPALGYLLVWADGESAESTPSAPHTGFRLASLAGSVALARLQLGERVAVDSVDYNLAVADQSFGSVPDGAPFQRQILGHPSPASMNTGGGSAGPLLAVALDSAVELRITWRTVPGTRYQLQAASDLRQPLWQTVHEFLGDGSQHVATQSVTSSAARYYRVLITGL
jgi:hypothetical protein